MGRRIVMMQHWRKNLGQCQFSLADQSKWLVCSLSDRKSDSGEQTLPKSSSFPDQQLKFDGQSQDLTAASAV